MYNPKSLKAEEFINHQEILDTLAYADAHKNDLALVDEILEKAKLRKGLSHREASVLLACDDPEKNAEIMALAEQIKKDFYGDRIVMFAPLYLSNYCVNGCVYCPYHAKNKHIARKKLTQEEVAAEVRALEDMGHKRLAIEAGEDPVNNPIEYILECIHTIYNSTHDNGVIRRVNVNIAATTVEEYKMLKDAGIGTSSRKPTTRKATSSSIQPGQSTTTHGTPKPWTAPWKAASTTLAWACSSGLSSIATNSQGSSCTPNIWKLSTVSAHTPSACHA